MNVAKWMVVLAVIGMLASMGMYVLTDDESIQPSGGPDTQIEQPVEAM